MEQGHSKELGGSTFGTDRESMNVTRKMLFDATNKGPGNCSQVNFVLEIETVSSVVETIQCEESVKFSSQNFHLWLREW